MVAKRKPNQIERYEIERSPLSQSPSQLDIAALVGETKANLQTLASANYKDQFIVRRTITSGEKERDLVYPVDRLRRVHERLKFHLNKIIQPSYLLSPRKGKAQRDNAAVHLEAAQFLTADIKQFYPSTTRPMIRNALMQQFGMAADVAGLIAHLATADDVACFGSPLTPVLATIVHREMFNKIADRATSDQLSYSVWVDDLTVSGEKVSGSFKSDLREIVAECGLRSHKLQTKTGNRPVFITGVGVVGANLIVSRKIEKRSKELWSGLQAALTYDEFDHAATRLLSHLGGIRFVVGKTSARWQKIASEMNSIKQKREKKYRQLVLPKLEAASGGKALSSEEQEARKDEIAAIAF